MSAFTLRVLPCLDNDPMIIFDVFVVNHPEFADGGDDDAAAAVARVVQRIVTKHPHCQLTIEQVEDVAPGLPAIQARARARLETYPAAEVLASCIAELHVADAQHLARHLEERRDLGQLTKTWQVRMVLNKLAYTAALIEPARQG